MPKRKANNDNMLNTIKWVLVGVLLVGFIGVLIWALVQREQIVANQPLDLVSPPETPVKVRPEQPGGRVFPHQERVVFDLLQDAAEPEKPTEAPAAPLKNKRETKKTPKSTTKPAAEKVATKPVAKPAPQLVKKPVAAAQGNWGVQLASFINRKDAERAILTYLERHADELTGLRPIVTEAEVNGAKRYRVRFMGLQSKPAAAKLCEALKANGQGCFYVQN